MSIIRELTSQSTWERFLAYRLEKDRFTWKQFEEADDYVEREQYLPIANSIIAGNSFSMPVKKLVNKMGSTKKRVVYSYTAEEMTVLKVIAHMLYKYDYYFAPNCYAFRRGIKASDAVRKVHRLIRNKQLWAYKLDISNYFNSVSIPKLLPVLAEVLKDDQELYQFFETLLDDDCAIFNGEIIRENRGIMAGLPIASFLANVYLSEMDHYFHSIGAIYARYSDDIIVFAEDEDTLNQYKAKITNFIEEFHLSVNPSKEITYEPGQPYEFLGFKCDGNKVDISSVGIEKMKGKIRRKMKKLLRWKKRKNVKSECAMSRMINYFNCCFFETDEETDNLNWSRWYFPIINQVDGLREIDHYLQQYVRVLSTGRHTKINYRVTYDHLKQMGYRSLVHEFYIYAEQKNA